MSARHNTVVIQISDGRVHLSPHAKYDCEVTTTDGAIAVEVAERIFAIVQHAISFALGRDSPWFRAYSPAVHCTFIARVVQNVEFDNAISIKMMRRH